MSTTKVINLSLGERISLSRKHAGLRQSELAEKTHITVRQFIRYEKNEIPPPSDKLAIIATNCEVDPGWLLSGRGNPF
jgi:transcriptional regulator with XRE-family HTH domain